MQYCFSIEQPWDLGQATSTGMYTLGSNLNAEEWQECFSIPSVKLKTASPHSRSDYCKAYKRASLAFPTAYEIALRLLRTAYEQHE